MLYALRGHWCDKYFPVGDFCLTTDRLQYSIQSSYHGKRIKQAEFAECPVNAPAMRKGRFSLPNNDLRKNGSTRLPVMQDDRANGNIISEAIILETASQ